MSVARSQRLVKGGKVEHGSHVFHPTVLKAEEPGVAVGVAVAAPQPGGCFKENDHGVTVLMNGPDVRCERGLEASLKRRQQVCAQAREGVGPCRGRRAQDGPGRIVGAQLEGRPGLARPSLEGLGDEGTDKAKTSFEWSQMPTGTSAFPGWRLFVTALAGGDAK